MKGSSGEDVAAELSLLALLALLVQKKVQNTDTKHLRQPTKGGSGEDVAAEKTRGNVHRLDAMGRALATCARHTTCLAESRWHVVLSLLALLVQKYKY